MPAVGSQSPSGSSRAPADPTARARRAQNSQAIADVKTAKDQAQSRLASANAAGNPLSLVV